MSVMTEEEMDYQIELEKQYSDESDSVESLYEFTESELSAHNAQIKADARAKVIDEVDKYLRELSDIKSGCSEWLKKHEEKIKADERKRILTTIHHFFCDELDKLGSDDNGCYKDTKKVNEIFDMNKKLCERIRKG